VTTLLFLLDRHSLNLLISNEDVTVSWLKCELQARDVAKTQQYCDEVGTRGSIFLVRVVEKDAGKEGSVSLLLTSRSVLDAFSCT
jgi:hypothetical protein